jgi:predicted dehydrogenase
MRCSPRLRVGIIGAGVDRGWGSEAHLPALRGLSEFELVAVANSRPASASAAAERFGIPLAFADAGEMAGHPSVDVAVVAVRAPEHDRLVRAVLAAKKHIYCEWPLGATTTEARGLAALAEEAGVRHIVGLQGYNAPRARFVAGLLADNMIGRLCAVSLVASGGPHGPTTKAAMTYTLDPAGGAHLLAVPTAHWLATLETMVGRVVSVSAEVLTVNPETVIAETGERMAVTSPDQVAVAGVLEGGALLSITAHSGVSPGAYGYQARLVGTDGTIVISPARTELGRATSRPRESFQYTEWKLLIAHQDGTSREEIGLHVRDGLPDAIPLGPPRNIASVYRELGEAIREERPARPDFHTAVRFHELVDAIALASSTGTRQLV